MKDETMKGWLVLPEIEVRADEVAGIEYMLPDSTLAKILPNYDGREHVQISMKGQAGVTISFEPHARVRELFRKALAELKEQTK